MSSLTLQLDADALREATVQAMLGVLTPEVKATMVENAIKAILAPSANIWERRRPPLRAAFEDVVRRVAADEAARMIAEDSAIRDRVQALLRSTAERVLNTDQEKLAERMSEAFVSTMRSRD